MSLKFNPQIQPLQTALGLKADGKRGPVTTAAILDAADAGRLSVEPAPPDLVNVPSPETLAAASMSDIPAAGEAKLTGVHYALASIIREASAQCPIPFTVIEGLRSAERQRELVARGASKTFNSRHLTGHAVDLWPLDPATGKALPAGTKAAEARLWADLRIIAGIVKTIAKNRGVPIEWGGDWGWDGPHVQLNRTAYPA